MLFKIPSQRVHCDLALKHRVIAHIQKGTKTVGQTIYNIEVNVWYWRSNHSFNNFLVKQQPSALQDIGRMMPNRWSFVMSIHWYTHKKRHTINKKTLSSKFAERLTVQEKIPEEKSSRNSASQGTWWCRSWDCPKTQVLITLSWKQFKKVKLLICSSFRNS